MPALNDHLRQAEHNRDFANSLDASKYSDWIAIALFYSALHYLDAFLATKGHHPGGHPVRDGFVAMVVELKPIYNEYRTLKNSAHTARYFCLPAFSPGHLKQLRDVHLAQIRDHLRAYIPIP